MAAASLTGCTADSARPERDTKTATQPVGSPTWEQIALPWGAADAQVGLRPSAPEQPAEGPSSIAVSPSGEVFLLDRLNERLIAVAPDGSTRLRASIPRDAEHLAIGPDGAAAAWSPLRATVWITSRDGAPLGEVKVPRELRDVQRIELGLSHRVHAVTSLQDTLILGSPRAPLDLASTLRTTREGAAFLADGRGVTARLLPSGAAELAVLEKPARGSDAKPGVAWTFPVPDKVSSVRIIGAAGQALCARLETVTQSQDKALAVEREVLCVEADSGKVLLRHPLGRPGLYTMHEELAVGGAPAAVVFARPEADGLHVERLPLATSKTAEVAQ